MANLDPKLEQYFSQLESEKGLPSGLLKSVAYTESRYNSDAGSPKGAQGMFQFMPPTAKQYAVDVRDPYSSAKGAAQMYSDLLKANNGDLNKALAGYNWGQGNLQKKGLENAPTETRNYISQINNLMKLGAPINTQTEKKNMSKSIEITDADIQAFNELQGSLNTPSQAVSTQVQQAPVNAQSLGITDADIQAFNELQGSLNIPSQSVNTQVQQSPVNVQNTDGSQIGQALFSKISNIQDPNKIADFYLSRSPLEQQFLKKVLSEQAKSNPQNESFLTNLGQGVAYAGQDISNSMGQIGQYISSKITGDNSGLEQKNLEIRRAQALRDLYEPINPSNVRTGGEIAGQVVAGITPGGAISKSASLGSKALQYGAQGALGAIVSQPANVAPKEDFLTEKAGQVALGATAGAIAGPVLERVVGAVAKPFTARLSKADEEFIALAKKNGYTPLASELPSARNQPQLQKAGQNLARDNKQVNELVTKNQDRATTQIDNIKNSLSNFNTDDYIAKKGLQNIAENSREYSKNAEEIINRLKNIDPKDPNAVLKTTAEANYLTKKVESSRLYDEASKLAPENVEVGLVNTQRVLDDVLSEQSNLTTPELKRAFSPIVENLQKITETGALDYKKADQVYKELGVLARKAKVSGDDNTARIYNNMRSAINKDKDDFVNSLPEDMSLNDYKNAYSLAKNYNRDNIQSVKGNTALRKIMEPYSKNGTPNLPDNLISNFVKKGQTEKVKVLYNNLDEDGKNAVQQGVLNKLIDSATSESEGFRPKAFMKSIRSYNDPASGNTPLNIVFDKKTASNLKELMSIFDNLGSIGYNRINPQTGVQSLLNIDNLKRVVGVSGAMHSGGLSLALPIFDYIKKQGTVKALTDPKFNKYLLDIRNTNPKAQKYVDRVTNLLTYITGKETSQILED